MENITKKLHKKRIILFFIILLWMSIVFYLSNENGTESNNTSSLIVDIMIKIYETISNNAFNIQNINILSYIVRKIAHFTLYFIGSIPTLMLFKSYNIDKKRAWIYVSLFCFLYACSDELHQLLSQGRNGNVIDVFIDTLGGITGIMFIEITSHLVHKLKIGGKNEKYKSYSSNS